MNLMPKILCVDDDPLNLRLLEAILVPRGYAPVMAENGMEALEKLAETEPALILMDVMMPRMNGFQACRKIKSTTEWSKIPVILLTAKGQESDKYWGDESGCNGYITKPFEMTEVIEKIGRYIQEQEIKLSK